MKKVVFLTTVMTVLVMAQNAMAAKVEIGNIDITGNFITVTGTAETADEYVTMVVRNNETNQLMTVAQKKTSDDKSFEIKFEMPSEFENVETDGEYKVIVNLNKSNADKDIEIFSFVREEIRTGLFDAIKSKEYNEIVDLIASDDLYVKALKVEGIYADRLAELDKDTQKKVFEDALGDKDLTDAELNEIAADINLYVSFYELKDGINIKDNLEDMNCVFDEKTFSQLQEDEKEYVAEGFKNIEISDYADFLDKYDELSVLCKINFARYSDLDELLKNYEKEIGLDSFDSYSDYKKLSSKQKQKVQEGIVSELKTPVYTYKDFKAVLKDEVKSVSQTTSNSGGGGGGGGSSSSKGSSSSSKNTFVTAQVPENVVLQADIEAAKETFTDIDGVSWAKDAILYLAENGIVSGRGNKKFAPNDLVTREEFVKMIVSAANLYDENAKSDFADVVDGSWYEAYVASAVNNGLVSGQSATEFGVGKPITRQDVCVIAAKLLKEEIEGELTYNDVDDISEYAREGVMKLSSCGIVSGMGENKFMPGKTCTRAQAAKIIYGILERR